ncbi:heme-binding domain-containing protein [Thermoflexus sp.]|uniref:heme-binding domain-containing protein n=1 Tax=Thermoflexus sp. TaxID=1969742 RepID=UPI0026254DAF|nr:heme-binding domain-containing protein [Thermoflexus sp.]MCX7691009.1 heme-binding domain-containing protein [Thermoflexus sp.]
MQRRRWAITLTILPIGIGLLIAAALNILSVRFDFLYRNVGGFGILRSLSWAATVVGALAWMGAVGLLAGRMALQPAPWPRKLLFVLPGYALALLLLGLLMLLLGIGTTGPFAILWVAGSASLTLIGAIIAALGQGIGGRIRTVVRGLLGVSIGGLLVGGLVFLMAFLLAIATGPAPAFAGRGRPLGEGAFPEAPGRAFPAPPGALEGGPRAFPPGPRPEGAFPSGPGSEGRLLPFRAFPSASTMAAGGGVLVALGVLAGVLWLWGRRGPAEAEEAVGVALGSNWRREGLRSLVGGGGLTMALLLIAQLIPAPRTNPPARVVVQWDSPQTQALWQRACADCHSNETRWPWYTAIAPASWLAVNHVQEGRRAFNLSELDLSQLPASRKARLAEEIAQVIRNGTMPPADYRLLHPEARLSPLEKELLIQGFQERLGR